MTAAERHRRDRQALFALGVGVAGAGLTWLASYLEPGQMLCIEKKTLLTVGAGTTVAARLLGELLGRIPVGAARAVLESAIALLRGRRR